MLIYFNERFLEDGGKRLLKKNGKMINFFFRPKVKEKRQYKRRECDVKANLAFGSNQMIAGVIKDVSIGGMLFVPRINGIFMAARSGELMVEDLRVQCLLRMRSQVGWHCQFVPRLQTDSIELYLLYPGRRHAHKTRLQRSERLPLSINDKWNPR